MRRALVMAVVLGLSVGKAAFADVHPNTAPGFPVEQSFHVGDIDNVNLFNGGLTLTIPIGGSYPVNGGFSYGLKLVYNSNPWLFKTMHYQIPPDYHELSKLQAIPTSCSNAGLGWRVSLGRMNPPCQLPDANDTFSNNPIYQDENGTDHIFYPVLHYGDAEDSLPSGVTDVEYTRDGSYLRLKRYSGYDEVEFPDGSVRRFDFTTGLPTQIRDAFGNSVSINYATANQWVITDSQGRTQRIYFRTDLPSYSQVVDHIDLVTFGGSTSTYSFNYDVQTIGRPCPHTDSDPTIQGSFGPTVTVPLLTSVTLAVNPQDTLTWTFNSYLSNPSGANCTENAGEITALTLPTLGRMEWTWQKYSFPTGSTQKKQLQSNPGVATRAMRNADGTLQGTWTYRPSTDLLSPEHSTTIADPLGHRTVNYFSTSVTPSSTGWSTYDYSLPFTRGTTLNVAPGLDLNLSRQVYNSANVLLRSEYVLYERDPVFATGPPDIYNTNRRPLRSRTVYNDDGGRYAGVINSNFDGLGHYRSQQTEGNFAGGNDRTRFGNYNPAQGTYTVSGNVGTGYSLFPASSAWVLEAPSYVWDSEAGSTSQVDFCYAPGSTAITRKRVHRLDGAAQGTGDLLTVYTLSQGNVTAEKSYGGDAQAIGTGNLCGLALPAAPEYEVDHTYSSGVRATSQYAGTGFFVLKQTIDPGTGLVSTSQDSAGLQTSYEYDSLSRLTWSKPQAGQGGWTEYVYAPATANNRANVVVRRRDNGSKSATVRAVNQIAFDSFGRVFQEFKTLPDGSSAKRETQYDPAGNKSSVSEWTVGSPANRTYFLNYDPFGRAATIRPPDGAAHDITMSYAGVRQVIRTVKVATAPGVESPAVTTEVYDRQGRLLSVTEPSGSGGADVTTGYGYDVGNRLISVSTTASVGGSPVTQARSFSYDRAGLLQSETHPEKGAAGNGTVTYPSYDSRGHALRKADGPNALTFFYDAAERLDQVKETGASGRLLKDFTYATANGTSDWSNGKLRQASRFNYVTIDGLAKTVQVTETYTYGGKDGRVSRRDTQVTTNGTAGESFTEGSAYNDLGLVSSLDYPRCTHAGCTAPAPAVFADVPAGAFNQREVEAIYAVGVTTGCNSNPLRFCPDQTVTRAEMAAFLIRASSPPGYQPPPACSAGQIFADVPCDFWAGAWIEELYRRGITTGCAANPLRYCPNDQVINAEMAAFLLRSKEGLSFVPPACTGTGPFTDVPCSYWAAPQVAEMKRRGIMTGCGGGNFCPGNPVLRSEMAGYLARTFDIPVALDPNTQRTVQFAYIQGLLTGVTSGVTTYGTLSYYPNLMVSQIAHGNGMIETQGNDPYEMRRPSALAASGPWASWSSGTYAYDGSGNIKTIGTAGFTYDKVSRLVAAILYDGSTGGGTQKQQSYAFDPFGNLTSIGGTSGRATPTSAQTNRLNGAGTVYDAAGNLTNWNGAVYAYDAFNQMTRMTSGSEDWTYVYTADDERAASYRGGSKLWRWTLRDLGGKVLREYQNSNGLWSLGTDYVYRDGLLLAAETQTGRRHFHLDHLGTPRLITRASGDKATYHVYYPFGEEATAFSQDTERMKFTGHERDLASAAGAGDDLDYMHARHESPVTGRFHSVDPTLESADPFTPQSWNRYNYVQNNPLLYIDPSGELLVFAGSVEDLDKLRKMVNASLHGVELVINKNGTAQLVANNVQGPPSPEQAALAGALSAAINRTEVVRIGVESGSPYILMGNYDLGAIDIQDMGALGAGPGVSAASALAHEVVEQTAKQVFGLDIENAHLQAMTAQNAVSGFARGRTNKDLFDPNTGNGYTLTEQSKGTTNMHVIMKWINGNLVKVIRK